MGTEAKPINDSALNFNKTPLYRNTSFQLMWASAAASGFGDRLIELAALPMLGALTHGSQAAGISAAIYFWFFLPWLFITPVGGWLADTLPRRWVMLACDEGRALILLAAFVMLPVGVSLVSGNAAESLTAPENQFWKIYLILACVGALAAVFSPTRNALIPQLVRSEQLNAANSIILSLGVVASLVGYVIGNWIFERYSVKAGVAVGMAVYGVSGLFFLFMKPRTRSGLDTEQRQSEWLRLGRAVVYLRTHRPVWVLVVLYALCWTIAVIVATTIAAFCKHRYGLPPERFVWHFALMNMALGVGMLLGSVSIAWLNLIRESGVLTMLLLLVAAVFLFLFAANTSYQVGIVLVGMIGFFGGAALVSITTMTQAITPNYILGRVGGVREVLGNASVVVVNFLIWRLPEADRWMAPAAYGLSAVLLVVSVAGLWTLMTRGPVGSRALNFLWRLDRFFVFSWHKLRWTGRENVPRQGPVILAANHTTGLDPLLMQAAVPRLICWVMMTSYQYPVLNFFWRTIKPIGLDLNQKDVGKLRQILQRLRQDEAVGLFPEGELQRDRRELKPFSSGIAMLAVRSGATIVPVWIQGTPLKKRMIWHFLCPSRSSVAFGKPYKPDPKMEYEQIAADLRDRMLALAQRSKIA